MLGIGIGYWVVVGVSAIIGMVVGGRLKSKFAHYSRIPISNGKTGKEVAEDMLEHYRIRDVQVLLGQGYLSDHYNPANKTVALSPEVYNGRTIAAASVAAHEVGHAIQHNTAYSMLQMRSKLVPVVQFSSTVQQILFMGVMFGGLSGFGGQTFMLVLVITFGLAALFSLVTLPVEFDASNRALAWLDKSGYLRGKEYDGAKDALWWAAMTYVSAALGAMAMFLYFLLQFLGSRE